MVEVNIANFTFACAWMGVFLPYYIYCSYRFFLLRKHPVIRIRAPSLVLLTDLASFLLTTSVLIVEILYELGETAAWTCVSDIGTSIIIQLLGILYVLRCWLLLFRFEITAKLLAAHRSKDFKSTITTGRGTWFIRYRKLIRTKVLLGVFAGAGFVVTGLGLGINLSPIGCGSDYTSFWTQAGLGLCVVICVMLAWFLSHHGRDAFNFKTEFFATAFVALTGIGIWGVFNTMENVPAKQFTICIILLLLQLFRGVMPLRLASRSQSADIKGVQDVRTLDDLLGLKEGYDAFAHYVQREFASENLFFWSTVREYKQYAAVKAFTEPAKCLRRAQVIYDNYVPGNAPYQVNISSHVNETITAELTLCAHTIAEMIAKKQAKHQGGKKKKDKKKKGSKAPGSRSSPPNSDIDDENRTELSRESETRDVSSHGGSIIELETPGNGNGVNGNGAAIANKDSFRIGLASLKKKPLTPSAGTAAGETGAPAAAATTTTTIPTMPVPSPPHHTHSHHSSSSSSGHNGHNGHDSSSRSSSSSASTDPVQLGAGSLRTAAREAGGGGRRAGAPLSPHHHVSASLTTPLSPNRGSLGTSSSSSSSDFLIVPIETVPMPIPVPESVPESESVPAPLVPPSSSSPTSSAQPSAVSTPSSLSSSTPSSLSPSFVSSLSSSSAAPSSSSSSSASASPHERERERDRDRALRMHRLTPSGHILPSLLESHEEAHVIDDDTQGGGDTVVRVGGGGGGGESSPSLELKSMDRDEDDDDDASPVTDHIAPTATVSSTSSSSAAASVMTSLPIVGSPPVIVVSSPGKLGGLNSPGILSPTSPPRSPPLAAQEALTASFTELDRVTGGPLAFGGGANGTIISTSTGTGTPLNASIVLDEVLAGGTGVPHPHQHHRQTLLLKHHNEEHLALVARMVGIFDRAFDQVTKLLTFDTLPRFLRSPEFLEFCETFNEAHQQPAATQTHKRTGSRGGSKNEVMSGALVDKQQQPSDGLGPAGPISDGGTGGETDKPLSRRTDSRSNLSISVLG